MHNDTIRITSTCIRVPVIRAHSEVVNIETEKKLEIDEVKQILYNTSGVTVVDNSEKFMYPMPADAAGKDGIYVGRIREDDSIGNGLNLWIVSDNLRKGAALNAVQIAERVTSSK